MHFHLCNFPSFVLAALSTPPLFHQCFSAYSYNVRHRFANYTRQIDSNALAKLTGMHYGTIWRKLDDAKKELGSTANSTAAGDSSAGGTGSSKATKAPKAPRAPRSTAGKRSKAGAASGDDDNEDEAHSAAAGKGKGKGAGGAKRVKKEKAVESIIRERDGVVEENEAGLLMVKEEVDEGAEEVA